MRKNVLCSLALFAVVVLGSATAHAQASEGTGLGAGAAATLTGLAGPEIVYQAPQFHIEGILGLQSQGSSDFFIGGRFFYEVHSGELSDFSLGGGLAIQNSDPDGPGDSDADLHLEAGAQIRAFLAPNVALSGTLGLAFIVDEDEDYFGILGGPRNTLTPLGSMGVTYFFF